MTKPKDKWKAPCLALCTVVEGFLLVLFYADIHGQSKRIKMPSHIAQWLDKVEDAVQAVKDLAKGE